jgi:hypothetical protein
MLPAHIPLRDTTAEWRTPFRERPQFIVIAVIGVMSGTFPHTYGVIYMPMNRWCIQGPSCHRHGERHGEIDLGKPLARYHDGNDAHDGGLRVFSRQGSHPSTSGVHVT